MAKLYIREFESMPTMGGADPQIWPEPGTDQTPLTYSTAAASAAFGTNTKYVAITSDGIFSYVVGANPTATTNHFRVPANTLLSFAVTPGHKISAITNT